MVMHGRKKLVFVVNTMNHRINVVISLCHSIRQLQKLESPDVDELFFSLFSNLVVDFGLPSEKLDHPDDVHD